MGHRKEKTAPNIRSWWYGAISENTDTSWRVLVSWLRFVFSCWTEIFLQTINIRQGHLRIWHKTKARPFLIMSKHRQNMDNFRAKKKMTRQPSSQDSHKWQILLMSLLIAALCLLSSTYFIHKNHSAGPITQQYPHTDNTQTRPNRPWNYAQMTQTMIDFYMFFKQSIIETSHTPVRPCSPSF